MDQPAYLKKYYHNQIFAITQGSCTYQTSCVNLPTNLKKQDKLTGQGLARRFNIRKNKVFIFFKTPIPPEAFISLFVPSPTNNLFMQFIKVFLESPKLRTKSS